HPNAVDRGPSRNRRPVLGADQGGPPEQAQQLLEPVDPQPFAPRAGDLDVAFVQGLPGGRLDPPAQLVQRTDLVGEQRGGREVDAPAREVRTVRAHHASASLTRAAISPSRSTFSRATV